MTLYDLRKTMERRRAEADEQRLKVETIKGLLEQQHEPGVTKALESELRVANYAHERAVAQYLVADSMYMVRSGQQ